MINKIQALIDENKGITRRTAFLDIAQARLENALAYTKQHEAELERQRADQVKAVEEKTAELEKLQKESLPS